MAGQSGAMSLLAYSVRRAVGALIVLLIVIWLVQFAVYHTIPQSPRHSPWAVTDYHLQFQGLIHQWDIAALEVGVGTTLLLALAAVWHLRRRKGDVAEPEGCGRAEGRSREEILPRHPAIGERPERRHP